MAFLTPPPPSPAGDFLFSFLSVLFEGIPYIFLGTLISGVIEAYLPSKFITRLLPRNVLGATMISGLLGFAFPVCECGVVPVIRRLVAKGLPLSAGITYMLSAPVISVIVAFSTWSAFAAPAGAAALRSSGESSTLALGMTASRFGMTYLIAVAAGLIVARLALRRVLKPALADAAEHAQSAPDGAPLPDGAKLIRAMRATVRDFLDTGMYFTLGVLITTCFNTQIGQEQLQRLGGSDLMAIPGFMILAFILSLCSTSDAFIVAPLREIHLAPKLAFLVFGPMLDIKLLLMYLAVFRKRFVLGLVISLFLAIGALCWLWGHWIAPMISP